MEDPLEELKRFIMNDGNTETNSCSMSKSSTQVDASRILRSMKKIADEISEIADDSEDDYLLYPDKSLNSIQRDFSPTTYLQKTKEIKFKRNHSKTRFLIDTTSQSTTTKNLIIDKYKTNKAETKKQKIEYKKQAHNRLHNENNKIHNRIQCKIDYYKEQELHSVKDKPEICRNSELILQQKKYLPIYNPQRIKNIIASKERWVEEQTQIKNNLKKEAEEREIEEMKRYLPKGKFNEDDFNEKYTRDISMYMQKFEMFKKVKQELDIEGVTFQPVIMNKDLLKDNQTFDEIVAERLYKNASDIKLKHEKLSDEYFKNKYTFKPKINKDIRAKGRCKDEDEFIEEKINQINIDVDNDENFHIIQVIEALKSCINDEAHNSQKEEHVNYEISQHSTLSKSIQFSTLK